MITVIRESFPVAKKDYPCDGCWFIRESGFEASFFTFEERRHIVKARKEGWKIKAGQKYLYQYNYCYGQVYPFRSRIEIHKICLKYNLYQEL